MRAVLQRVTEASVEVNGHVTGAIKQGSSYFLAFNAKIPNEMPTISLVRSCGLRIFNDDADKMNRSVIDSEDLCLLSRSSLFMGIAEKECARASTRRRARKCAGIIRIFCHSGPPYGHSCGYGIFQASMASKFDK